MPISDSAECAAERRLVSVVIPVFNGELHVADAVESALDQRDAKIEVIVVDDGSTDRTPAILAGFGPRITVIRQQIPA